MSDLVFKASGKLLLFGEYLVLRGAKSIAIPLHYKQLLHITSYYSKNLLWECYENNKCWLRIEFSANLEIMQSTNEAKANIIQQLLRLIQNKKPNLKVCGLSFRFDLDFDRNYGFGTSSTLLSLLSQWSGVDPYLLQRESFPGSGFDIAAATARGPFIYQMQTIDDKIRRILTPYEPHDKISNQLLFIFTGKKQHSLQEVRNFRKIETLPGYIQEMNTIVSEVEHCTGIEEFENLMFRSEKLLSDILNVTTVKEKLFEDYPFAIKSLGAWGGDFVMATYRNQELAKEYFNKKGMTPVFTYPQLIKT